VLARARPRLKDLRDFDGALAGWKADSYFLRSQDRGVTWSKPIAVSVRPFDWAYPFGTIHQLKDGTLLLSGYGGYLPRTPEDSAQGLQQLV